MLLGKNKVNTHTKKNTTNETMLSNAINYHLVIYIAMEHPPFKWRFLAEKKQLKWAMLHC